MQPATFEASLDDGYLMNITACVRLPRRSLDGLCMKWAANDGQGRVFAEGSKSMSGTICQLRASLAEFLQVPPTGGVFLRLRAELESDAVFAPKGHIVAQETVTLMPSAILHGTSSKSGNVVCPLVQPPLRAAAASPAGEPNVQNIGKDECRVDAAGYSARICKGEIVSLRGRSGYELLSDRHGSALGHAFWRAPTDNDRCGIDLLAPGPIKKLMPVLAKLLPQEHISFARQWRDAGLENGEVVVRETVWEGAGMTVRADFRAAGSHARLFSILTVATFKAANVHLQVTVLPAEDNKVIARLQTLPRIGARLILQPSFSRMSWMGCGPHECYPDRKAAAPMNLHQRQIEELHVPYMVPSESGGVTDVRWTALQDSSGRGLLIQYECQDAASNEESIANAGASLRPAGMRGAQVSAARWTPHAKHDSELPRAKDLPVVVHVDTAHCGVGGTGGATEAVWRFYNQYLINPSLREGWNYNLVLTPLEPGELDISASSPSQ
ncbi:unnamed protein product [Polarella glacialis]|nr:unnamed protein product [Polarella glacialis]